MVPNLIEMLGTLLGRAGGGLGGGGGAGGAVATTWMREILFAVSLLESIFFYMCLTVIFLQDDFVHSKATLEVKEKFLKAVIA